MENAKNKLVEASENMVKTCSLGSEILFKKSFSIYKIKKDNIISKVVIIAVSFLGTLVILGPDIVSTMEIVSGAILDCLLAMFGIVFTGYALLQAMINEKLLKYLMEDIIEYDGCTKNKFSQINENFLFLMLQFVMMIFITLITRISLGLIPKDFCLFKEMWKNNLLAGIMMFTYFFHIMSVLHRMVSFLVNIFKIFSLSALATYNQMINNKMDDN